MISLNALLGRPVEYYEYPWAMEGRLRDAQSRFRSLFQPSDVGYIFAKSMPRSGHRFLSECSPTISEIDGVQARASSSRRPRALAGRASVGRMACTG